MAAPVKPLIVRQRELIFHRCKQLGLDRADRLEIATIILDANVDSFDNLTPDQVWRLVDVFEGAWHIGRLHQERRTGHRR